MQPFKNIYYKHSEKGEYRCKCCDAPLFTSVLFCLLQFFYNTFIIVFVCPSIRCGLVIQFHSAVFSRSGRKGSSTARAAGPPSRSRQARVLSMTRSTRAPRTCAASRTARTACRASKCAANRYLTLNRHSLNLTPNRQLPTNIASRVHFLLPSPPSESDNSYAPNV